MVGKEWHEGRGVGGIPQERKEEAEVTAQKIPGQQKALGPLGAASWASAHSPVPLLVTRNPPAILHKGWFNPSRRVPGNMPVHSRPPSMLAQ